MDGKVFLGRFVAVFVAVFGVSCARAPTPDLGVGLPDALSSWVAVGDASEFVGDELFMQINGGAEVYHEYGFERLTVREYGRGEDRVSVEVYTVADSAYGVYSYARSDRGLPIDIGIGGALSEYYLCAWSGHDLIVVTAQTEMDDARSVVVEVADGLTVPAEGETPAIMSSLPRDLVVPGSQAYVQGPLALRSVAAEVKNLLDGFDEAAVARVRASGSAEALVVVGRWREPGGAVSAMKRAADAGSEVFQTPAEPDGADRLRFDPGADEVIELALSDEEIWIVIGPQGAVGIDEVLAGHREEEQHGNS